MIRDVHIYSKCPKIAFMTSDFTDFLIPFLHSLHPLYCSRRGRRQLPGGLHGAQRPDLPGHPLPELKQLNTQHTSTHTPLEHDFRSTTHVEQKD